MINTDSLRNHMEFTVLSHACLRVSCGGKTLLVDPWLLGSCYWRSWWNYPPVDPAIFDDLKPDVIYLTHVHWDHFHGPTLKKFAKDTQIVIPYERSPRVYNDLHKMGFTNIVQLPHAKSLKIGPNFEITDYQFSSPWGDSALVIEADGVTLLNANDCKIMGGPLNQIMKKHGSFDFAFRSHSSANDGLCYEFTDTDEQILSDDPDVYAESFVNFMTKIKPRYAVPFASNHCHLHRDVYHFNEIITTPYEVVEYVRKTGEIPGTELKVMLSGDSWNSDSGFNISEQSYFSDRASHLAAYRDQNIDKLNATYAREEKINIGLKNFERFFNKFCDDIPGFLRKKLRDKPIVFTATKCSEEKHFLIEIYSKTFKEISTEQIPTNALIYSAPAIVLKQALAQNMFAHIGISKRAKFRLRHSDRKDLEYFKRLLAAYEYDVLPLKKLFSMRTVRVYTRRWRELLLYVKLVIGKLSGKSIRQLEAENLR